MIAIAIDLASSLDFFSNSEPKGERRAGSCNKQQSYMHDADLGAVTCEKFGCPSLT
jgi:hypothetical protein